MVADLHAAAYLADGADLAATGVTLTHDGSGLYAGLADNVPMITAPGVDGGIIPGGVYNPFTHSTMYVVRAAGGFDAVWTAIRALRRRCKPGKTIVLTRQMPDPEGGSSNTNQTQTARRLTDRVEWIGQSAATVDIDWQVADGVWYGAAVAIAVAAGTQSVLGDTDTHRMTLTLAAGAARTVTNTTNGYWFTFGATVPSGGVLIDVEARTAIAITGGADLSVSLSWGKAYPFRLEAGSNVLTVSAGSASISYQPAYL